MSKVHPPERYVGLFTSSVLAFLLERAQEDRFKWCVAETLKNPCNSPPLTCQLARATVVDYYGKVLFDSFVRPTQPVVNYRTASTGIEQAHVYGDTAQPFDRVQDEVTKLITNRIIIGHSLWTDLAVLGISHLAVNTRDIALYMPFRDAMGQRNQV
ncbi:hypothetical protein FS749_001568 [Ceratobasidium sp. UAMH 11750]|nr:hypothetical protein FS749_001568 [Ceratobasidium sp. UAMH 11750]